MKNLSISFALLICVWTTTIGYGQDEIQIDTPELSDDMSSQLAEQKQPDPESETVGEHFDAGLLPPKSLPQPSASDIASVEPGLIMVISPNLDATKKDITKLRRLGLTVRESEFLEGLDFYLTSFYLAPRFLRAKSAAGLNAKETLKLVRRRHPDIYIGVNHRYQLLNRTQEVKRFAQKSLQWDKVSKQCGTDIRIGLLDTLVDTNHPALENQRINIHSVIHPKETPADSSHGTAIAGILVGNIEVKEYTGLLPNAQLEAVNVFRQQNDGSADTNVELIIKGLDYLASLKPKVSVINMSFGGSYNMLIDLATHRALQHDIIIVAAAGNSGPEGKPIYPAALQSVVSTTAIDAQQNIYTKANQGDYIDYAAPGVDIWTATNNNQGQFVSGTSYAAPFVSALLAYTKQQQPNSTLIKGLS